MPISYRTAKVYTQKELVLIETSITEFHEKFYILEIQKLVFHLLHVSILITHHCGKEWRESFKLRVNLHDVLCCIYYAERIVSSFSHQIQSEYYGGSRSVSIEGIDLEHFSASHHLSPLLASYHVSYQAVFHYFLSYYIKQDSTSTDEHIKHII